LHNPQLSINKQISNPIRKATKSFGSSLALRNPKTSLRVDLSEDLMKFSESQCIPLSCRNMINAHSATAITPISVMPDTHTGSQCFGVSIMRGNFRKT